jgi:hypothetical protein
MGNRLNWAKQQERTRLSRDIDQNPEPIKPIAGVSPEAPLCLRCGSWMRVRESQYGPFWGCGQFPKCKGLRFSQ